MNSPRKVKFLIILALLIVVTLLTVIVFQLCNIIKTNNKLKSKQDQIERLEKEIDYWQNKQPESDYEVIL